MKIRQEFVPLALQTGIPFGLFMGIFYSFTIGYRTGVPLGVVSGLLFGLLIAWFAQRQQRHLVSENGLFEGEEVYLEGPANHFLNGEGRGGWLTLTPTRLVFRSHGKNVQNAPLDLPLSDIERAEAYQTLGIIPNGLRVFRVDQDEEHFVVARRRAWVEEINLRR